MPAEACERVLREWSKETGRAVPEDLHRRLHRIRQCGYERRASYQVRGIVNISCPLYDAQGHAVAALTVPYMERLHEEVNIKRVEHLLLAAAHDISAALGLQAAPAKG